MLITLFEDDAILAIDKPSGLPSNSLVNSTDSCESQLKLERPSESLLLVHRLDTGTSGVLVFAKTETAFNDMREQFRLKNIQKRYVAWSEKTSERAELLPPFKLPLTIDTPLAHHAKSKKKMIALGPNDRHFRGKPIPALSIVHGISEDVFQGIPAFRFELEIVTGVMHQIRVHLSSLGFPLMGDATYDKKKSEREIRLGLHARKINFNLNGFQYEIESPFEVT